MLRRSVVSDSLRSHGLQPTKFLCPWGFSRQLEWVAMPFSRGSSEPRDRTQVSHIQADSLSIELPRRAGRVDLAQFLRAQVRFPGGSDNKEPPAMQKTWVQSLGWEDLLEKGMVTHSSILV